MKKKLEELKGKIKALAEKEDISDEEAKELQELMQQAERVKAQIKAAEFADESEDGGEPEADSDEYISTLATEVAAKLADLPGFEKGMPFINTKSNLGDPDPVNDFYNYIRTGKGKIPEHLNKDAEITVRGKTYKAALQEGTTTEGGYLVPAGELGRIIEQRDEASLVARLGVTPFTTDRDVFNIPTEATAMTKFTIVAEEGAISDAENEPVFGQAAVTLYAFEKTVLVSWQLLEDYNSGLEAYLDRGLGRAWAMTENYYSQIGSGSSQPQGVFVGGTAGLTLDSASAIGAAEVPELLGKLQVPYRNGAVVIMNRTTAAYLAGLTGNQFQFRQPMANIIKVNGEDLGIGYPVIPTEDAAVIAASAKSMLFGNFEFYGWVRNRSLRVQRLVELYAGTGQIGILATFRAGGKVLQAEAFQYATHPSA